MPAAVKSINVNVLSNNAYATNPWYLSMVSYNHVGSPNSMNCQDAAGDASFIAMAGQIGPSGSTPPTSNHPGGVHLGMADGSVRFVRDSVAPNVWWAIGTRYGREVVDASAY